MSIERGDLVDLDEGEPHLLGERREMPRMQAPEMVLQQVQVFDQQVAPALAFAEQFLHLAQRGGIDLPPLRIIRPAPPARPGVNAPIVLYRCCHMIAAASLSPHFREEREKPLWIIPVYTAPSLCIAAISSLPYPNQSRISSVCSPRSGERFTSTGESESLIGEPTCT